VTSSETMELLEKEKCAQRKTLDAVCWFKGTKRNHV